MKVTLYPDGGGTPIVLGDDAARDFVRIGLPSQTRISTPVQLYGAEFGRVFAGGNRLNSFTLQTDRDHASLQAAEAFAMDHADAVPLSGVVEVTQQAVSRWLAEAVIAEVRCLKWDGRSTIFTYTIMGGQFLSRNPNQ